MNEERAREYIRLKGQLWDDVEEMVTERYGMKLLHTVALTSIAMYGNREAVITVTGERISDIQLGRMKELFANEK